MALNTPLWQSFVTYAAGSPVGVPSFAQKLVAPASAERAYLK